MFRTIVLHGDLAKQFGKTFRFDIDSIPEAVRALDQLKGFRKRMLEGAFQIVIDRRDSVEPDGLGMTEAALPMQLGGFKTIHIVPAIAGAGSGTWQAIIGVAIIAASFALAGPAGLGATAFTIGGAAVTYGSIAGVGLALTLSGIATMLSRPPNLQGGSAAQDRNESFLFGGQQNVVTQGGPVPVVIGKKFRTGGVLVSVGLETQRI